MAWADRSGDGPPDRARPKLPSLERPRLELWGGMECSIVRIGDEWRDQLYETGHYIRAAADIRQIAELGVRTLRYPLLWERNGAADRTKLVWQDEQMAGLRDHGITPIAGLVHHGAGPPETDLLDPLFGERLAVHAARMAQRYPLVTHWAPVNEPLTTARFSCLYGHWHPHLHDEGAFLRAVANQCRAAMLAMRAIRKHHPSAQFVQTEDIGCVFSTPELASQALYENDRRWLSLDLLCGCVTRHHPWRRYLEEHGVPASHLDTLATGEGAPDIIGVNHYATSDRFLDHRLELYPPRDRGGNGRLRYVDIEAMRARLDPAQTGWAARLREVWARYGRRMALTEVHLGCVDPSETVRWVMEAWNAALTVREEGADCVAVTAWALFGMMDWNTLLRERQGCYEPGVFDARYDPPRRTPVAEAIVALARDGSFDDAALLQPGWWRRDDRMLARLVT